MVRKLIKTGKKLVLLFTTIIGWTVVFSITLSYAETKTGPVVSEGFYNPFKRIKHGPPIKDVTRKVDSAWLFDWIKNPKDYNSNVRMPYLLLEDEEVKSVMAYLASIADKDFPPKVKWDAFLNKPAEELTDEEHDRVNELVSRGKEVWEEAQCSLCHAQKGIGGMARVAPDLGRIRLKISNRDWLYFWLKNPRDYFPNTMMVQFGLSDEELKSLIEYILRSKDFMPEYEEKEVGETKVEITYSKDPTSIENGKRIITISRCVICHDIEGIKEILPVAKKESAPTEGFAKLVYEKRCLTCHNIRGEGGKFASAWDIEETGNVNFLKNMDITRSIPQSGDKGRCPLSF